MPLVSQGKFKISSLGKELCDEQKWFDMINLSINYE